MQRSMKSSIYTLVTLLGLFGCGGDGSGNGNGDGGAKDGDGGASDGDGGTTPSSCKKIDIVFSVDPSGSMTDELEAMKDTVFPAFATALRSIGGGLEDYRVAVIDGCPTPADFHTRGEQGDCGFEGGKRWMTSASSSLDAEFSCVGDIYTSSNCSGDNDDEQPIAAAVASLTSPFSGNENLGFLRDDALLVVVTITDEDECPAHVSNCNDTSNNKATEIYNQMVAIKGDVKKMVYLGIGGGLPNGCSNGAYGDAAPAILTNKIANLFVTQERGVSWDLCDGALEDGLTAAIEVIEKACEDFPEIE